MSVRIMAMVWDCEALPHKHRLMMLALADHAGDDGLCWPSVTTLAEKCGIHERNAQKQLRALEEDGWIVVAKSKGGRAKSGEKSRSNHYCLNLGALFDGARSTSGATLNPGASATLNPGASATLNPGASATPNNPGASATLAPAPPLTLAPAPPLTLAPAPPEPSIQPSTNHQQTNPRAKPAADAASVAPPTASRRDRPTETTEIATTTETPRPHRNSEPPGFTEWWDLYPKKCGKGAARPAYSKALGKVAGPWVLAEGLRAALPQLADLEPRFIPNPATWLNQERWLDQPPPKARGSVTRQIDGALAILHRMDDERRQP